MRSKQYVRNQVQEKEAKGNGGRKVGEGKKREREREGKRRGLSS